MENRDRDKMSKNTTSTPAGDVNRNTSSQQGQKKSDSSADFGQKIGQSENLGNEPTRRPDSGEEKINPASGVTRGGSNESEH